MLELTLIVAFPMVWKGVSLILEDKVLATRDFVNLDKSEETAS